MFSVIAYALSAWCYVVAIAIILWIVPHVLYRFGLLIQVGLYLFAVSLIIRGYEAWSVADGANVAQYWLFRNALAPLGATCIILGEVIKHARRKQSKRLKCVALSQAQCWVGAIADQSVERGKERGRQKGSGSIAAD